MKRYVVIVDDWDPQADQARRKWHEMVPEFNKAVLEPDGRSLLCGDRRNLNDAVVIVHKSYLRGLLGGTDDAVLQRVVHWSKENPKSIWIVIYGGDQFAKIVVPNRVYVRGTQVSRPGVDEDFGGSLAAFLRSCEEGITDFSLLEPEQYPDELLAVYLTTVGIRRLDPIDARKIVEDLSIWETAKRQFSYRRSGSAFANAEWPAAIIKDGIPNSTFLSELEDAFRNRAA